MTALLLALLAAVSYGVSDFIGGLAARRARVLTVVLVAFPLGTIGLGGLLILVGGRLGPQVLLVGGALGVLSGLGVLWFYAALAAGPMSVVSPLTALLVAGLPLLAGVAKGERPGPLAIVGAAVALVAVVLVSREERTAVDETPSVKLTAPVVGMTIGSGTAYAAFFVLLDGVPADSGLWPLFLARAVASVLVVVACALRGVLRPPRGLALRLAVGAAVLDVLANVAFLYGLRAGLLSLVSVITALYPAATVLLARVILGERPGAVQRLGLGLAAAAVTLIAVGS
jgi:drug/metabolite transporter (DMT)-like permease